MNFRTFSIIYVFTSMCLFQIASAQGSISPSFYPLATGNVWQYDAYAWGGVGVWDTTILAISRDSTFDGHSYFVKAGRSLRYKNTWQTFERSDSSGDIFQGDPAAHQESLLYRLSDTSRSWWDDGSARLHRFDSCGVKLLFGAPRAVLYVGEYSRSDTILQNQRLLVEGIGYYTTYYLGLVDIDADILHGARINGTIFGTVTSVQHPTWVGNQTDFELRPPHPNPFNPWTTLSYSLTMGGRVRIDILDILGRVVEQVLDQVHKPGTYTVKWSAASASSGLYICRMTLGDRSLFQKLVVLK